jgi:hypothetical protein
MVEIVTIDLRYSSHTPIPNPREAVLPVTHLSNTIVVYWIYSCDSMNLSDEIDSIRYWINRPNSVTPDVASVVHPYEAKAAVAHPFVVNAVVVVDVVVAVGGEVGY